MDAARTEPIFPRLSSGPRKMDDEAVARHQRGRLQGAMVEAVARNGYQDTTLRELVTLAGVSKSTFYEHFDDKQDCFLATFDTIVDVIAERIDEATSRAGSLRERLRGGLDVFMRTAAEEQAAAVLVAIESLKLGAAGLPSREKAGEHFEAVIRNAFEEAGSGPPLSDLVVRGIVAGIRNCLYQHLRAGRGDELPDAAGTMVDWALSYDGEPGPAAKRAAEAASVPRPPVESPPPDGDSRRERIVRAAAKLTVANGYESLTIPAISAAAGVSNQTFYDHFASKEEALLAGFAVLAEGTLRRVTTVFLAQEDKAEAIGAGLRALLDHTVEDELFPRLAFFELPMAGPAALDQADNTLSGFTAFLEPDFGPREGAVDLPGVVKEAVVGGGWAVIQHEIAEGRLAELPERAPEIAQFVAAPFDRSRWN